MSLVVAWGVIPDASCTCWVSILQVLILMSFALTPLPLILLVLILLTHLTGPRSSKTYPTVVLSYCPGLNLIQYRPLVQELPHLAGPNLREPAGQAVLPPADPPCPPARLSSRPLILPAHRLGCPPARRPLILPARLIGNGQAGAPGMVTERESRHL